MTTMILLLVVHAVFALPASGAALVPTKCEVGKEDLVGTSKYFTVQVCNLFGATCYMNHVSLTKSECATKALKIPHESCALFPIISYKDNDNSDAANRLVGDIRCGISCETDGTGCKFAGACVSVQCSLGDSSWAGTAISSTRAADADPQSAPPNRQAVTDASDPSKFTKIPIMSLSTYSRTLLLSRTGNFVAAARSKRMGYVSFKNYKPEGGSEAGLVGEFPVPHPNVVQSGPTGCPLATTLMSEINETADQLRTCTIGTTVGSKYMYAGVANLLSDTLELHGYQVTRNQPRRRVAAGHFRRRYYEIIERSITKSHTHSGSSRRRRTSIAFMSGVLQRYTYTSESEWPKCFQYFMNKGIERPCKVAEMNTSSAVIESQAFAANSLFSGEPAGTYRNYIVVFYCTDYARKDLRNCSADKGAVFYVADPSPALHFGKKAESIATAAACPVGGAPTSPSKNVSSNNVSSNNSAPVQSDPKATSAKVVTLKLTLKNLDYQKLAKNATLKAAFIAGIKKAIANKAGAKVLVEHITLVLSSGSVVVDATIDTVAAGVDHDTLKASLTSAKSAVESDVLTEVKQIAGIESIKTGTIEISSDNVMSPKQTTSGSTTNDKGGGTTSGSVSLECSGVFTLGIFLLIQ